MPKDMAGVALGTSPPLAPGTSGTSQRTRHRRQHKWGTLWRRSSRQIRVVPFLPPSRLAPSLIRRRSSAVRATCCRPATTSTPSPYVELLVRRADPCPLVSLLHGEEHDVDLDLAEEARRGTATPGGRTITHTHSLSPLHPPAQVPPSLPSSVGGARDIGSVLWRRGSSLRGGGPCHDEFSGVHGAAPAR
jgi:hypothetical protein